MVEVPTMEELDLLAIKVASLEQQIAEIEPSEIPENVKQAVIVLCDWLKEVCST